MLNKKDIEFMRKTRKEIIANRTRPLTVIYSIEGERNKLTGVVEKKTMQTILNAVVTDIATKYNTERHLSDLADVDDGDIWFSIDIDELVGINPHNITSVIHNGQTYLVVAEDPKGIGRYIRHEFVGRLKK